MSSAPKKTKKTGTSKKKADDFEPGSWECTVCTYRNNFEAFKCDICDTRKGTSTRKPRLNFNVVQQQTLVQNLAVQNERALKKQRNSESRSRHSPESNTSSQVAGPSGVGSSTASSSFFESDFENLTLGQLQTLFNRPNRHFPDWLVDADNSTSTAITIDGVTETIIELPCRLPNFDAFRPYDVQQPVEAENNEDDGKNYYEPYPSQTTNHTNIS